jgi:hypothetical protein
MKQRYYLPFLSHPISLGILSISWVTIFISGFPYVVMTFSDSTSNSSTAFNILRSVFEIFLIIGLFSFVTHFIKKIIYKFQIACFVLIAINFLIILAELDFFTFLMFTDENVYSWYALLYIIVMLVTITGSSAYYVYCYKVKKERVLGYGGEAKKSSQSLNYGIIFGLVLMVPFLLTGNLDIFLNPLFGLLFSILFPGLIVDSFYAAYLIHKDPEYKEKR